MIQLDRELILRKTRLIPDREERIVEQSDLAVRSFYRRRIVRCEDSTQHFRWAGDEPGRNDIPCKRVAHHLAPHDSGGCRIVNGAGVDVPAQRILADYLAGEQPA